MKLVPPATEGAEAEIVLIAKLVAGLATLFKAGNDIAPLVLAAANPLLDCRSVQFAHISSPIEYEMYGGGEYPVSAGGE